MFIYIDGLFYKSSGIGRYYSNILKILAKEFDIVTCVPKRFENEWQKEFYDFNIDVKFVDYEKFDLKGLLRKKELASLNADIYFFPQINLPLFFKHSNIITTIHDLIPLNEIWGRGGIKRGIIKFLYKNSIKRSKKIIAISNETKKEIIKYFGNADKIEVIYNFIKSDFCKIKNEIPLINEDYILYVGNRKPHKNLKNLILAFKDIKSGIKLVIAGAKDKDIDDIAELIEKYNLKNRIIEKIKPSDKELLNLYYNSKLFVFPSLYEGFGYPPLEAISCNTPVIASNIDILTEILGEKIACFNPNSVKSIQNFIKKALDDNIFRNEIENVAKERLKLFSQDRIEKEYIDFFKGFE